MNHFFKNMEYFANSLIAKVQDAELISMISEIDHVCYRVPDSLRYEAVKLFVGGFGTKISEAVVNGRPIATYKLFKPVYLRDGFTCQIVEIPSPKSGRFYEEGFEHIEAVTKVSLEELISNRTQLNFDTSNLNSPVNADISLQFDCGLVKFHETSLEKIIEFENENI